MYSSPAVVPARRKMTGNTILFGVLVVIALGVAGLFTSESMKHGGDVTRAKERAAKAELVLSDTKFDSKGQVAPKDRAAFESALSEAKRSAEHIRTMSNIQQQETMIAASGLVAALVFGFLAFRSTRATA
jgi:hypothetical protein